MAIVVVSKLYRAVTSMFSPQARYPLRPFKDDCEPYSTLALNRKRFFEPKDAHCRKGAMRYRQRYVCRNNKQGVGKQLRREQRVQLIQCWR